MARKILFVHHGTAHGGAPLSLLYTALGARNAGYLAAVALAVPSDELRDLYGKYKIPTIDCSWLSIFHYSTVAPMPLTDIRSWLGYAKSFFKWRRSQRNFVKLIIDEKVDIVHLNSMALINSAILLQRMNFPFVWHVREPAIDRSSFRGAFVSKNLRKCNNVIFISREDQESWLGDQESHGTVVHNFIDFDFFASQVVLKGASERRGKLPNDALIILYVGGLNRVKGIIPLLYALSQLKESDIPFYCLMPGSLYERPPNAIKQFVKRNLFLDFSSKVEKLIAELRLASNLIRDPFEPDIRVKFAMADVVVFPSIRRHFARPIIEATAMGKPVVASNFPGIQELVDDTKTGFLVPPNDSKAISEKLALLYHDSKRAHKMGKSALKWGIENFNAETQIAKILEIYANVH